MFQIEEVVPDASARPIRQVADNEGKLLKKFEWLMFLITGIAMTTASLGVAAAMNTSIFERKKEIGLMKAIGADGNQIAGLFFAEAAVTGIIGGAIGILIGIVLARIVGHVGIRRYHKSLPFPCIDFRATIAGCCSSWQHASCEKSC